MCGQTYEYIGIEFLNSHLIYVFVSEIRKNALFHSTLIYWIGTLLN